MYTHTYIYRDRASDKNSADWDSGTGEPLTHAQTHIYIQAGRQIDRQTNLHTCMHANIHTYIYRDRASDKNSADWDSGMDRGSANPLTHKMGMVNLERRDTTP